MDYTVSLLISISVLSVACYFVIDMTKRKKLDAVNQQLQSADARLSQLRMALKTKVKRKSTVFRSMYNKSITIGSMFDVSVKSLLQIKFDVGEDFELYFNVSKEIVNILKAEKVDCWFEEFSIDSDYMTNDLQLELEILRIMKEMMNATDRINSIVDEHENEFKSHKFTRVEKLTFPSASETDKAS